MLHKSSHSKRIKPVHKLYVLGALVVLLAVVVAVLAWVEGNIITTVIYSFASIALTVAILGGARNISRRREAEKAHHATKLAPRERRVLIFLRALCLLALIGGVVLLAKALESDAPLYVVLKSVWLIVAGVIGVTVRFEEK